MLVILSGTAPSRVYRPAMITPTKTYNLAPSEANIKMRVPTRITRASLRRVRNLYIVRGAHETRLLHDILY